MMGIKCLTLIATLAGLVIMIIVALTFLTNLYSPKRLAHLMVIVLTLVYVLCLFLPFVVERGIIETEDVSYMC